MGNKETLKPCMCGNEAQLMCDELGGSKAGTVMCMTCFTTSNSYDDWRDAIKAWNTRTPTTDTQNLIEWLEGQKKPLPDPPRNRYRPEHTHNTALDAVIEKLRGK